MLQNFVIHRASQSNCNHISKLKQLELESNHYSEIPEMARAGGITNAVNVGIAVQADWENREFISHVSLNVRRLFDFLVQFGMPHSILHSSHSNSFGF